MLFIIYFVTVSYIFINKMKKLFEFKLNSDLYIFAKMIAEHYSKKHFKV